MVRTNRIREALKAGKPTVATHIHTTWPSVVEAIALTGAYDYIEFVAEYAPYTLHDLDNLARAAELHGVSMMLKPDQANQQLVSQHAIGSGFHSILFVDIRSPEDARQAVRIVKPETPEDKGIHGVATRRITYMGYGGNQAYVQALRDVVVAIMIEKKEAVERLDEILDVPGIDMVQWGPSDYSMSIGKAGQRGDAEVAAASKRVFETCLKKGIQPRAEIGGPEDAKRYLDMGVKHFCMDTDISLIYRTLKKNGEELRALLG